MHFDITDKKLRAMLPAGIARRLDTDTTDVPATMARRTFLKMGTVSGFALGAFAVQAEAQGTTGATGLKPHEQPSAFVQIDRSGIVTVTINRLEFGQGVHTGLPMILAEELDADWSKVRAAHGNAAPAYIDPAFGVHLTGGSGSIKNSYTQYREIGARTRAMLVQAAASQWGVPVAQVTTDRGVVMGPAGKRLGYGELVDAAMRLPVPQHVTLKDPKQFRIIGQPTGRLDAHNKSTGEQSYGIDVRLPGMLTAVCAHPPVFKGKVASLNDKEARAVPGVKAVVRVPMHDGGEGVAVIATGYWPARKGREALKINWDLAGVEKVDSAKLMAGFREMASKPGLVKHQADVSKLNGALRRISAEYVFPYLAHAPMEPLNCTVQLSGQGDAARAEVWAGTQMPGLDANAISRTLSIKEENIKLHVQMAGGGFGRRAIGTSDYIVEACSITKAARAAGLDAPIRTLWSREDDIRGGYYRPAHVHRAEIAFDATGRVLAWDHVIVGQSIMTGTPFEPFMVKDGIDNTMIEGMKEPYELPMRLSVHNAKANVPVLWWRSVGSTHTAYVMETLIDEISRTIGVDPIEYRLRLMDPKASARHRGALQLAVDKSGYGKRKLAAGRAWGVAVHESFQSVVAYVVEASLEKGSPKLHAVTAGVHCNLAVNPKSVEAQVQGAAVMGLGMCLPGAAITLKDGVVEQSNFSDFTVPRMTDAPAFAVHIVPSADPPTGMGEPGLPPLAPAFANAISRLTGQPLRELPFNIA